MQVPRKLFWAVVLTAALVAVAGTPQASAQGQASFEQLCEASFKTLDTDRNGKLSVEEFVVGSGGKTCATRKVLKEQFLAMDLDGDGVMTRWEYCVPPDLNEKPAASSSSSKTVAQRRSLGRRERSVSSSHANSIASLLK